MMPVGHRVVFVLILIALGGKFPTDLPTYRPTDHASSRRTDLPTYRPTDHASYPPTHLPTSPPDTTVTIRASSSTLAFEPPELAVKQGTRVRIRFVNAGTLPHNFVLVRREEDIDTLATIAAKIEGSFIPLALKDRMIAWTPLAAPGQTVEVEFVVPPPGVYPYVCLMTGHSNSMMGTLRSLR